jgi:hypothetical protein
LNFTVTSLYVFLPWCLGTFIFIIYI